MSIFLFETSFQEWCKEKTGKHPKDMSPLERRPWYLKWKEDCAALYERVKDVPVRSEFEDTGEYVTARDAYWERVRA
jgi:hypothetical protein